MHFEVAAAYGIGVAMPLLETLRRRTYFETIARYVDDFIAGGLLLFAAYAIALTGLVVSIRSASAGRDGA